MKNIILTLLFSCCLFSNTNAQWMNQVSGTTRTLYDIEFLDKNTGWAVGVGGTIRKTTNGGINWFTVSHPAVGKLLNSIHLVDSNIAYVVGYFETIIKTTNGGNNWVVLRNGPSGEGDSYEGVFFINKDTGWICGTGQKVLRTTNGGSTFDSTFLFWGYLRDMYFKDGNTGVMVAEAGGTFKATDAGLSWFRTAISLPTNQPFFYKLSFINQDTGWIVGGDGRVFRTTNCGTSWDSIYHLQTSPVAMYGVEFVDYHTGWVCGENARIYKTTNSGQSWGLQQSNTNNLITSISFYNDSVGWASCGFGGIIHTINGGLTFLHEPANQTMAPYNYRLFQNYPNPFNPKTIINYEINAFENYRGGNHVELRIYDVLGIELKTLVNKNQNAGIYSIEFDGNNYSSGIYFYKLTIGNFTETKKMILQK